MTRLFLAALIAIQLAPAARAEGTSRVAERDEFVQLIQGRALTRLGINLNVTPDGAITGRAFGTPVKGAWRWQSGLFCRDLFFGDEDLGPNCQVVERRGDTLRFIADEGRGDYADLRLK